MQRQILAYVIVKSLKIISLCCRQQQLFPSWEQALSWNNMQNLLFPVQPTSLWGNIKSRRLSEQSFHGIVSAEKMFFDLTENTVSLWLWVTGDLVNYFFSTLSVLLLISCHTAVLINSSLTHCCLWNSYSVEIYHCKLVLRLTHPYHLLVCHVLLFPSFSGFIMICPLCEILTWNHRTTKWLRVAWISGGHFTTSLLKSGHLKPVA